MIWLQLGDAHLHNLVKYWCSGTHPKKNPNLLERCFVGWRYPFNYANIWPTWNTNPEPLKNTRPFPSAVLAVSFDEAKVWVKLNIIYQAEFFAKLRPTSSTSTTTTPTTTTTTTTTITTMTTTPATTNDFVFEFSSELLLLMCPKSGEHHFGCIKPCE